MANIGTRDSASSITATGTTQSDAFAVVAEMNYFSTVASGTGAILDSSIGQGERQVIYNGGANQLTVYPHSTAQINSLGTNTGILLPIRTTCEFVRIGPTLWTGILSK